MRARMKTGHRPVVLECALVPEHPTYWTVPESSADGVALLVEAGLVEYEPAYARAAVPQLQLQQVPVASAPARGGSKKGGR